MFLEIIIISWDYCWHSLVHIRNGYASLNMEWKNIKTIIESRTTVNI